MCGIAGCFCPRANAQQLTDDALTMAATLVHRGPDAQGVWAHESAGVAFGFQRLAIVDLTPTGMQPMHSHSGRYTLVCNGEIYNHHELRAVLGGVPWRGSSDTEVVLAAFDRWGIRGALDRFHGMYAMAVWDHQRAELTLIRDRRGEKPLYYGVHGGTLLFGSELKALRAHPAFRASIDHDALAAFMYASFVPSPASIWQGTYKLPAASVITITAADVASGTLAAPQRYWQLPTRTARDIDDRDAIDEVDRALREVVARQLLADVPVGAFLSGGIDSSTVVSVAQAISAQPVKTFTIGIPEHHGLDESTYAGAVAKHLGTDHHALQVTPEQAREVIPGLGAMYDEPFADASQIPTHLVARLARSLVTVALSGDGGDELFGGYRRYTLAPQVVHRVARLPRPVALAGSSVLSHTPARALDALHTGLGDSVHSAAGLLTCRTIEEVYVSVFGADPRLQLVPGDHFDAERYFEQLVPPSERDADAIDRMMRCDALAYIPDDINVKVDRAAMAVSLETRMPFLDHGLAALAWSLPSDLLIRGDVTKWVLRQVLARYVPPSLTERPKAGFGLPIGTWLRGPLRDWADDLLSESALAHGHLDTTVVRRVWRAHRSGRHAHTRVVWNALMFQEWLASN